MKKALTLVLAAAMLAALMLGLSGCGSSKEAVDVTGVYVHEFPSSISGTEKVQVALNADGRAELSMPDNSLPFVFNGAYTNDGTTVSLKGMKEDEPLAGEGYPGFEWSLSWINATGDGQIVVDKATGTYDIIELPESERRESVVASMEPSDEMPEDAAPAN